MTHSPTPEAREAALARKLAREVLDHSGHFDDMHVRLAEALLSALDTWRPKWRPIEEAPKDGTRFLFTNGEIVGTGFFVQKQHFAADSWQGARNTEATHYLPLPSPPLSTPPTGEGK